MKTWLVMKSRVFPDDVLEIRGELEVVGGALVFSAWNDHTDRKDRVFRVINDYAECWAVNAEGEPLRPAE